MRIVFVLAVAATVGVAAPARADNCLDPKDIAAGQVGRPCDEVTASFGGVAVTSARSYFSARSNVLRIGLFDTHGSGNGLTVSGFEWESIDVDGDPQRDLASPFGGDKQRMTWSAVGFRFQHDRRAYGWYAQLDVCDWHYGQMRQLAPRVGARAGAFDRAAVIGEVRFPGVFDVYSGYVSPFDAIDVGLRTTAVVLPWLRLETRSRYRDATTGDHLHVRDVQSAVGVELAVAGKDGFRSMPVFVGVGVHRALAGPWTAQAGVTIDPDSNKAEPTGEITPATTPHGWELMLQIELDFSINSARAVW